MTPDKTIGVVMLDTRFPRLHGDIGNPATFSNPVIYKTVPDATPESIVRSQGIDIDMVENILSAVRSLAEQNVDIIATSCGFLAELQSEVRESVNIPVVTSALTLLPFLQCIYGNNAKIGILTFDSDRLNSRHLGQNITSPLTIEGLKKNGELYTVISQNKPILDKNLAEQDAINATMRLCQRTPDLDAIILECTNLSPYIRSIRCVAPCPVFDINQAIDWILRAT